MITKAEDVKIGMFITYESSVDGIVSRKFYTIHGEIHDKWILKNIFNDVFNKVIHINKDSVFKKPNIDEVFETLEELQEQYPEYFI